MIAGYKHLHTLGIVAEALARNAWMADGISVGGNDRMAENPLRRALSHCREIGALAADIRRERGMVTLEDDLDDVLSGRIGHVARPGKWSVHREGGKITVELQSNEA